MNSITINVAIKTLTPVHLGTGEVYDITSFWGNDKNGANEIVVFEPFDFISSLTQADKRKFTEYCCEGNAESLLKIMKFAHKHRPKGREIKASTGFIDHYRKTLSKTAEQFRDDLKYFAIERTAYLAQDQRPYIPGSAVKGALRTAFLSSLARKKNKTTKPAGNYDEYKSQKKQGMALQENLLAFNHSKLYEDPFRLVKVSDFVPVGQVLSVVRYAVNRKKTNQDRNGRGVPQLLEFIDEDECCTFFGTITVDKSVFARTDLAISPTTDNLFGSLREFYLSEHQREADELKKIGVSAIAHEHRSKRFLIRLGRHSGAECMTLENNRSIQIMGKRGLPPQYGDHATTIWLAADDRNNPKDLRPIGWVEFNILEDNEKELLGERERRYKTISLEEEARQYQDKTEHLRQALAAEEAKRQASEEKRLALEAQKAEAERKRMEREAMSPEDRMIARLGDSDAKVEQEAAALCGKLDTLPSEPQFRAAQVLKDYYIKIGKWDGQLTEKQKGKKKKIEQILQRNNS